jgi:hypothetical protein
MKAKTYFQFINEAYLDHEGELHDFNEPSREELIIADYGHSLQEFLDDLGATQIKLRIDDQIINVTFEYSNINYRLVFDYTDMSATISSGSTEIYQGSMASFISAANANGLNFLNY